METEEEVDILMSSDVYSATLSTKSITFARAQTGWLFREDKTVTFQTPESEPLAPFPPLLAGTFISSLFTRVQKKIHHLLETH